MGIQDILMYDETLFKDMLVFNPDFIPDTFNFRNQQMEAMAYAIKPIFRGSRPDNLLMVGPCATGKTTSVKKVFEEVKNYSEKFTCAYINCQLNSTKYSLLSEIYRKVIGHAPPSSGVPHSELYNRIIKYLEKEEKSLILALDEADILFSNKDLQEILYLFLRTHEKFPSVYVGLFVIVSTFEFVTLLDQKVKTLFLPQEISFEPYSYNETYDILSDRAKIGFYPDIISDELIDKITEYTLEDGDLRTGISLLKESGFAAERDASKLIAEKHVNKAIENHISVSLKNSILALDKDEIIVLKLIVDLIRDSPKNDVLKSSTLTNKVKKERIMGYDKVARIINKLEFLRIIDTVPYGKSRYGRAKVIYPKYKIEDLDSVLENEFSN